MTQAATGFGSRADAEDGRRRYGLAAILHAGGAVAGGVMQLTLGHNAERQTGHVCFGHRSTDARFKPGDLQHQQAPIP